MEGVLAEVFAADVVGQELVGLEVVEEEVQELWFIRVRMIPIHYFVSF